MSCIVGRKKLIHNAPYDVLSVSRVTSQVDLCCNFRCNSDTSTNTIPLLFVLLLFFLRSTECWVTSKELNSRERKLWRTERQKIQHDDPRLVRCRIFSGDVTLASLVCARTTRSFLRRPRAVTYN